ncbi:uncharacterized protein LOC143896542 [Temnothorax americanus]|uniref:uncharacterized protein LOC143896542 n=1 Tax=Temnothorax americanus TaxID=1964332 RepID=UPI0040690D5B
MHVLAFLRLSKDTTANGPASVVHSSTMVHSTSFRCGSSASYDRRHESRRLDLEARIAARTPEWPSCILSISLAANPVSKNPKCGFPGWEFPRVIFTKQKNRSVAALVNH